MADPQNTIRRARTLLETQVGTQQMSPETLALEYAHLLKAAEAVAEGRPGSRSDEQRRREVAQCTLSLAAAIQEAGGNVGMRDLSVLNLTLGEFICEVAAQNGIRFAYTGPRPTNA